MTTCGTPVTCPEASPYLCADNTCKRDIKDCLTIAECPLKAPVRCPDNTCVDDRNKCKRLFDECPSEKPVRCSDFKCYGSSLDCFSIKGCPRGFELCEDGTCATSQQECKPVICPAHLSYRCLDGFCVEDISYCDETSNGCPHNAAYKCPDGSCVADMKTDCPDNVECELGKTLCPDGSC